MNIALSEGIVVALIAAIASVAGTIITNRNSEKKKTAAEAEAKAKAEKEIAVKDALLHKELQEINKKLDEHNNYAKRFEEIEKAIVRIDTKLESIKESNNHGN